MRSNGSPVVSKVEEVSLGTSTYGGDHGSRFSSIAKHWRGGISHPSLGNVRSHVILLEDGGAITSLITGKKVSLVYRHSLVSEPLIVVINDPTSLASTQVQYIPHPCSRGPMTGSKKLKSRCEDREDDCSRVFLFFYVRENEMLDSRLKARAYFLNGLVNSVEDHSVRISARVDSAAFFPQHHLPQRSM